MPRSEPSATSPGHAPDTEPFVRDLLASLKANLATLREATELSAIPLFLQAIYTAISPPAITGEHSIESLSAHPETPPSDAPTTTDEGRAHLLYRNQFGQELRVDLPREGGFMGRSRGCLIQVDDPLVSRTHCRIFLRARRWHVSDTNSANGLYVNNRRVQLHALRNGDIIGLSSALQLRFIQSSEETTRAAQSSSRESNGELDAYLEIQIDARQHEGDKPVDRGGDAALPTMLAERDARPPRSTRTPGPTLLAEIIPPQPATAGVPASGSPDAVTSLLRAGQRPLGAASPSVVAASDLTALPTMPAPRQLPRSQGGRPSADAANTIRVPSEDGWSHDNEPLPSIADDDQPPSRRWAMETVHSQKELLRLLLSTFLTGLQTVADEVNRCLYTQQPGRKRQALESAAQLVGEQMQRCLPAHPDNCLAVLREFERLIKRALREVGNRAPHVTSPFVAGSPLDPQDEVRLHGRQADLNFLEQQLDRPGRSPSIMLFGPGRIGKTSLLRWLPSLLGARYIPVWIDCGDATGPRDAAGLLLLLVRAIQDQAKLMRGVSLPPLPSNALEGDPYVSLRTWLTTLRPRLQGYKVLLCLDEFQGLELRIQSNRLDVEFLATLRTLTQTHEWLTLLLSGRGSLEEMADYWPRYFNECRTHRLECLSRDAARELFVNPTGRKDRFPIRISDKLVNKVMKATGGHPLLIQAVGDTLTHHLNSQGRLEVQEHDLGVVFEKVLTYFDTTFQDWYRECRHRPAVQDTLRVLIREPRPRVMFDDNAVKILLRDQLIIEQKGFVAFRADLVRRYWALQQTGGG